jgi:hypothetical protein
MLVEFPALGSRRLPAIPEQGIMRVYRTTIKGKESP